MLTYGPDDRDESRAKQGIDESEVLSVCAAAQLVGVSTQMVTGWLKEQRVPSLGAPSRPLLRKIDLLGYIDG